MLNTHKYTLNKTVTAVLWANSTNTSNIWTDFHLLIIRMYVQVYATVCVCLLICFCYFLLFVPYLSIWFLRCARARSLTIEFYCYFPHLFSICLMFNKVTAGKYDISFRFFFVLLKSGHCKINYWQYCMLYPFSDRLFLLLHIKIVCWTQFWIKFFDARWKIVQSINNVTLYLIYTFFLSNISHRHYLVHLKNALYTLVGCFSPAHRDPIK